MQIKDVTNFIESFAPLNIQESYDNCGLITGKFENEVSKVLIALDLTEEVMQEAINKNCNMIITHHPLVFTPLKKIQGQTHIERTLINAIKNNIAIYAAHTNLDFSNKGLSHYFAKLLSLEHVKVLKPLNNYLRKIVTFCPLEQSGEVRTALFEAGAGHIGNYDCCSFNVDGQGSFRASEGAKPFVGHINTLHFENEVRIETIYPLHLEKNIISALLKSHPYEEVAYDIYSLENTYSKIGAGIIGEMKTPLYEKDFLNQLKKTLNIEVLKHSKFTGRMIKRVAFCSGSGSSFIPDAIAVKADIFISSEFKYNHFIDVENKLLIADIGHFESESFAKELIYNLLKKNFSNFAVEISTEEVNPVKYL
ncbi:MAG: Nif3-like dinuclear metal center hexameric protein [Bacteroidales bacterium]|nr:Nif3-like dinuclear metal center hexameric protein [Bacteroidales bacterium]